uniref:Apple domain-containing protein n=1 Tax=Romanomermis culicivorax TaxID=13658 RepID=A0A915JWA2_ROMCU
MLIPNSMADPTLSAFTTIVEIILDYVIKDSCNYGVPHISHFQNMLSIWKCGAQCIKVSSCTHARYDRKNEICYFKQDFRGTPVVETVDVADAT